MSPNSLWLSPYTVNICAQTNILASSILSSCSSMHFNAHFFLPLHFMFLACSLFFPLSTQHWDKVLCADSYRYRLLVQNRRSLEGARALPLQWTILWKMLDLLLAHELLTAHFWTKNQATQPKEFREMVTWIMVLQKHQLGSPSLSFSLAK